MTSPGKTDSRAISGFSAPCCEQEVDPLGWVGDSYILVRRAGLRNLRFGDKEARSGIKTFVLLGNPASGRLVELRRLVTCIRRRSEFISTQATSTLT